jgi:hypothetical protein
MEAYGASGGAWGNEQIPIDASGFTWASFEPNGEYGGNVTFVKLGQNGAAVVSMLGADNGEQPVDRALAAARVMAPHLCR